MLTQQQIDVIYETLECPFHFLWGYMVEVRGVTA
ncbi:DUF596 domain-containing protein, partial [Xylella fastidiosa subsp. multiplex]|nr:DUF596 domain-containing protein [Xylella fastidiosa subsp. multiplex]